MIKTKYDNRGLSLLELMVAIAISMMVFTVILTLSSNSIKQYRNIGTDVDLQNEAQLTSNQIRDWMMEVNEGVSWEDNDTNSKLYLFYTTDKNELNEKEMIGEISFDKASGELYYKLYEYGVDESGVEAYLLSNKVEGFYCDMSNIFTDGYIIYTITYDNSGKQWDKTNEFTFRNEILVVDSAYEIFGR